MEFTLKKNVSFELIKAKLRKIPCGVIYVPLQIIEGREGNRFIRDNIPCSSLADAVNLPCARSHANASKLGAVLVDQ